MSIKVSAMIVALEPEEKPDRYKLAFHLHDTRNCRRVRYVDNEFRYGDPEPYIWVDGNYACDCNRSMFMGYPPDDQLKCGDLIELERIEIVDDSGAI